MLPVLSVVTPVITKVIDKLFPDPEQAAKAKMELALMEQQGHLRETEVRLSAIIMEAQSSDPWTSRARPSFLYVIYIYILAAIPMGFMFMANPEGAQQVIAGVSGWLAGIPDAMWTTFTVGYLGYVGARSLDKAKIAKSLGENWRAARE